LVPSKKPVLIADPDAGVRGLLSSLFERVGYPVREASAGDEALRDAQRHEPALAILDVALPGISGYELCRELKETVGPDLPVVLVSAERTESFDRVGGLLVGADDYIVKPFDPDEMLVRARRLLERERISNRNGAKGDKELALLTRRELEVLRLLAEGMNQAAIARELVIAPKTVSTHLQRILTKLGVHNQVQAVAAAYRLGIAEIPSSRVLNP
jgi:DNA-binding NarL/FixJ family response regulator